MGMQRPSLFGGLVLGRRCDETATGGYPSQEPTRLVFSRYALCGRYIRRPTT